MAKYQTVETLKLGDKFEFLTSGPEGAKPIVLVVTRAPAVNKAANSCHFRYQSEESTSDVKARWNENQSWNGTPDVKVQIVRATPSPVETEVDVEAVVDAVAETEEPPPQPARMIVQAVKPQRAKPAKKASVKKTAAKKTAQVAVKKAAPKRRAKSTTTATKKRRTK